MNLGLTPDELTHYVKLPAHLRELPYLQEYYGCVDWSVKSYFSGTLGWFDGNPASLFPLGPDAEAKRIAEFAGGLNNLVRAVRTAMDAEDYQWALELSGRVLRLEPSHEEASVMRISALRQLADQQMNACARNYYLLCAKQAEKQ